MTDIDEKAKERNMSLRRLVESLPWEQVAEGMEKIKINKDGVWTIAIEWNGKRQGVNMMIFTGSLDQLRKCGYENVGKENKTGRILDSFWINSIWSGPIGIVLVEEDARQKLVYQMYIGVATGHDQQKDELMIAEQGSRLPGEWITTIFPWVLKK